MIHSRGKQIRGEKRLSLLTRAAANCSGKGFSGAASSLSGTTSHEHTGLAQDCSPLGLPYKGGPIKRLLQISIYKAHQRDQEQRGQLPLLLTSPSRQIEDRPQDLTQSAQTRILLQGQCKSLYGVDTAMGQHTFSLPQESGARLQLADNQHQQQKHALPQRRVWDVRGTRSSGL